MLHHRDRSQTPACGSGSVHALRLEKVTKVFGRAGREIRALDEVSLVIPRGTFTALMGPSGSGKSTLLYCAIGLETPTSGSLWIGDTQIDGLDEAQLTSLRRARVGFVSQSFNLVPALTVAENILLPRRLAQLPEDRAWCEEIIARVGLRDRVRHFPSQLSGGQQQRVAIARALVTRPDAVLADEPTGSLDTFMAKEILMQLRACVDETAQTVVMVTHDPVAASFADTVLFLADGQVVDRADAPTAARVAELMTGLDTSVRCR
ncbi:ABC transporter ATP-binding protein [Streptomyces sp. NPDC050549]|uniref:ABC transporter ATP-binding protein n=1 Tax=Streptomyces sp. NPDC050549 TaxID=3155406 RepID=UPI003425715A